MLTNMSILTLPESRKEFMVFSDASLNGLSFVLAKDGECNYPMHDLEDIAIELWAMFAQLNICDNGSLLAKLRIKLVFLDWIKEAQLVGITENFSVDENDCLRFRNRIHFPKYAELKELILRETHISSFAMHPDDAKMYYYLQETYWWPKMKKEIVNYVAKCLTCQRVKVKH
ncbi:NBS-LRR resistance-like protein [Gossypium australe]|uniref:NBS-LRR resistance-like protein n=1 Tax=Gossypium australe TaxID=47621 RepID=A0A5B6WYS4_9ROSI|nr:NBS-LRR resistance-like protein [Gossypium australe]